MEPTRELSAALAAGDAARVRALIADLPTARDERDALLGQLADAARRSAADDAVASPAMGTEVAVELLVEAIDRSGLPRAAAARVLITEDAVEEVAQDVLIAVATSIAGFDGRSKVSTWVHAIARHRAIDYLRRQRATVPLEDDLGPVERISSVIATRATIDQLLARLPDDYRHAVALRDVEQLAYDEVAARLGCSPSTARTRVARGRALAAHMIDAEATR